MNINLIKKYLIVISLLYPCFIQAQTTQNSWERGEKLYKRCAVCHFIDSDANRIGPSLQNIIGRAAGVKTNFRYSPAMKKAGNDNFIWDKNTLKEFLLNPKKTIKGNRMANIPFRDSKDIDDIISYIMKYSTNIDVNK